MGIISEYSSDKFPKVNINRNSDFKQFYNGNSGSASFKYHAALPDISYKSRIHTLLDNFNNLSVDTVDILKQKIVEAKDVIDHEFILIDDKPLDIIDEDVFNTLNNEIIDFSEKINEKITELLESSTSLEGFNEWLSELDTNYNSYCSLVDQRRNYEYYLRSNRANSNSNEYFETERLLNYVNNELANYKEVSDDSILNSGIWVKN